MSFEMSRKEYADLHGPTVGDSIRLGDTDLYAKIEKDYITYGEEVNFGGGKVIRDGMGQNGRFTYDQEVPDLVITNVVVLDYTGIYKADVAIRNGRIQKIGNAGNPDIQDNIDIVVGVATDVINGAHLILTAGAIDTHIHYISPDQAETALANGTTTFFGGGTGPTDASNATTVTPGPGNIEYMLRATQNMPVNIGILGKGHAENLATLEEQIRAGAAGLKIHEDWASTPASIDRSLTVADKMDVQVAIHTDTLNEAGFVDSTIKAIDGRVIHTFHTEGAGGGHAPDILKVTGLANVLPASTNPTLPYTKNTIAEHFDMLITCHGLNKDLPEDVAFADSRIRPGSIGAEDVMHDLGILSITSSDSQAMGRVGEVVTRTWQVAHQMKTQRGPLEGDSEYDDNNRIKRYISKYTVNPAIAQGISHEIGSVEEGKLADLVLWDPRFFGAKPEIILKSGRIIQSVMGDSNGSIPTPQPRTYRTAFGARGSEIRQSSVTFLPTAALEADVPAKLGLERKVLESKNNRNISKADLKFNSETPTVEVDPQTYEVRVNGEVVTSEPAAEVSLGQRYFLF